jgi:hypothetical protein
MAAAFSSGRLDDIFRVGQILDESRELFFQRLSLAELILWYDSR